MSVLPAHRRRCRARCADARFEQPQLVVLAVNGQQAGGDLTEHSDRHRPAPDMGLRERPSAATVRTAITESSSTSPPAADTISATPRPPMATESAFDDRFGATGP